MFVQAEGGKTCEKRSKLDMSNDMPLAEYELKKVGGKEDGSVGYLVLMEHGLHIGEKRSVLFIFFSLFFYFIFCLCRIKDGVPHISLTDSFSWDEAKVAVGTNSPGVCPFTIGTHTFCFTTPHETTALVEQIKALAAKAIAEHKAKEQDELDFVEKVVQKK